jgi:hypothetical protein
MNHFDDNAAMPLGDRRDGDAGQLDADEIKAIEPSACADAAAPDDASDGEAAADESRAENSGREIAEASRAGAPKAQGADLRPINAELFDLTPFFERNASGAGTEPPPSGRLAAALNFGSNAAFVLCVLGVAFATGTYLFGAAGNGEKPVAPAVASAESLERAEMLRKTEKMADDISALKATVDALRISVAQGQAAKDQHGFEKSVDVLKAKLDAVKTETSGALAELSNKVDHLQRDPTIKQVVERLDRIEKQTALPTGSIGPMLKAATQNRNQSLQAKTQPAAEPQKRPSLITDWVVRGVYDGVALVENARGAIEVALGDEIPGAGTVKAIERRGGGWIVITSRGLVDYDHSIMVP